MVGGDLVTTSSPSVSTPAAALGGREGAEACCAKSAGGASKSMRRSERQAGSAESSAAVKSPPLRASSWAISAAFSCSNAESGAACSPGRTLSSYCTKYGVCSANMLSSMTPKESSLMISRNMCSSTPATTPEPTALPPTNPGSKTAPAAAPAESFPGDCGRSMPATEPPVACRPAFLVSRISTSSPSSCSAFEVSSLTGGATELSTRNSSLFSGGTSQSATTTRTRT
mmetsp:Transcript_39732/g.113913  ORF Transcript_39732/g.113913 Transcript_39732/m.113913 type:complete len:228 (+) Transcript_39732:198-881(+)